VIWADDRRAVRHLMHELRAARHRRVDDDDQCGLSIDTPVRARDVAAYVAWLHALAEGIAHAVRDVDGRLRGGEADPLLLQRANAESFVCRIFAFSFANMPLWQSSQESAKAVTAVLASTRSLNKRQP
jgi:hypothetical protein